MSKKSQKICSTTIDYADNIDKVVKVLHLYNGLLKSEGKQIIFDRHIHLLAFYIVWGFSHDISDKYAAVFRLKSGHVNVLNSELAKYGFLVDKRLNSDRVVRDINPNLYVLRKFFVEMTEDNSSGYPFVIMLRRKKIEMSGKTGK